MAYQLVIPAHTSDLFDHPMWLVVYFVTFAVIASVWFYHQRLFGVYFVPSPVTLVANFIVLSMVGLLVFFMQVFGRIPGDADRELALLAYFCCFGIAYLVMGLLYWNGMHRRWTHLTERERRTCLKVSIRMTSVGGAAFAGAILTARFSTGLSMDGILPVFIPIILAVVGTRVGMRLAKERIDRAVALSPATEPRHA